MFFSSQFNSNNLKHNLVVNFRFLGNIWRHCCFAILYHNIHLLWFGKCILLYLQNNNVLHLMPIVEKKKLPQYIVVHTLYIQCIYYTDYIAIENCQCSISENHSMQFWRNQQLWIKLNLTNVSRMTHKSDQIEKAKKLQMPFSNYILSLPIPILEKLQIHVTSSTLQTF